MRGWATRLLFILTRCSRLVATEESSPFGSGGGSPRGAYMTVQPRSKGPGRLRRFSGFPMLRNQLSLDTRAAGPPSGAAHAMSPRGGASPLLRSATAPSRSIKDLMAGMHHLRIHEGGGPAATAVKQKGGTTQLSPMPESPSTVHSPSASGMSTPSHPVRGVGLSPLGRSVVTALEAELEQAARADAAASVERQRQRAEKRQQLQGPAVPAEQPLAQQQRGDGTPGSSGTSSPIGTDSPSKRQNIFKLLKLHFQKVRSASKEPPPVVVADAAGKEGSSHGGSQRAAAKEGSLRGGMPLLATPQVGRRALAWLRFAAACPASACTSARRSIACRRIHSPRPSLPSARHLRCRRCSCRRGACAAPCRKPWRPWARHTWGCTRGGRRR